jgi:flavin reductase (DIM6/NTAB) family NADH-FMN oxidoreductase RutF
MTATRVTQISFDPEIVVVVIEKDSHTCVLLEESKGFSLSILKSGKKEIAAEFAKAKKEKEFRFVSKKTSLSPWRRPGGGMGGEVGFLSEDQDRDSPGIIAI